MIHVTTQLRCILIGVCKTTKAFIEVIMFKYVQSLWFGFCIMLTVSCKVYKRCENVKTLFFIIMIKEMYNAVFDFSDHLLFSKVVFVF